ncbi:PLP-dependent transferase [Pseudovirgaria hyperparasitica]|uniref:cystathionine gamma-synthase n=1 Tax=Pseudovirgaria hyperparasitica TaxID=470096 RepID=A0A6A6WDS8_9PEZI|nr:PLP-dependent transferase [Pseudovirgaria hyperparasitica]KAF2760725.1 PLP-dependent transferase [Pseudovirgaria hyperparasitica]
MAVAIEVGETIPPLTAHAVSVSLPTWRANVGYEEGERWVVDAMKTGYPRFFIHKSIARLAETIVADHALPQQTAMLFPSHTNALQCQEFLFRKAQDLSLHDVQVIDFVLCPDYEHKLADRKMPPKFSAVLYPQEKFSVAKQFWQHTGCGLSSRRAEYCHQLYDEKVMVNKAKAEGMCRSIKGPKRYQKKMSIDQSSDTNGHDVNETSDPADTQDSTQFVEERFGRHLGMSLAPNAKLAVKRRIAGNLTADVELSEAIILAKNDETTRLMTGFSEDDVYLFPNGMNAIYNTHRNMRIARGEIKSISFGFPYVDSLKILEKFGPGCLFYGFGESEDLDNLEKRLADGERYLALFCEFPGNPLLKCPDLERIHRLADQYDFMVVVDETIGNFLNVDVLQFADVVVSSLTKIFSGDCNVMGGSAILNPKGKNYDLLKKTWDTEYEDNVWSEDAIVLERNSRDFVSRIERINGNAEAVCDLLREHPKIKQVNYPKYSKTRQYYDRCRLPKGGYGGLLSATFYATEDAIAFYDHLDTAKGPSLGTNFTLSSPYVILAHYGELDWAASLGVDSNLVRFSIGLEEKAELVETFRRALAAIAA